MQLVEIGLLGSLPRVELAKLLGEAEELQLRTGETLQVTDAIFFVVSGAVRLCSTSGADQETLTLLTVGPGEMVGEWALLPDYTDPPQAIASRDSTLFRIPVNRWRNLIDHHPDVNQQFQQSVLSRLMETQRTLGRYKRHLSSYASEIWPSDQEAAILEEAVVEATLASAAVDEQTEMPQPSPHLKTAVPLDHSRRRLWIFAGITVGLGAAAAVLVALLGMQGAETWVVSLVLTWTAINWYLGLIPEYVVALGACLMTVAIGVARPGETFSGFADPTWFLLLGAFGIGVAIQRSGLLYRAALHLLRVLPPTYTGQAVALAVAGTVLTPCLPSVQSRVAMAGLLARELTEAMRFRRHSKGAAGLAMSAFLGFGQMRFLFLNGSSYSLLAWGLLPPAFRQTASWAQWFWVALPLGFLVLISTHWVTVYSLFREEGAIVSQEVIDRQLAVLGKMSGREKITMWVALGVVIGFILQPLHQVDASWIALIGFLLLVVTGIIDKDMVTGKIDWQYMLFYGSLAGLVTLISKSQLSQVLNRGVEGYLGPVFSNPILFLLGVAVITMMIRLIFQPGPAIILVGVTLFPLSVTMGYHPLVAAVVAVASSCTWLVPQLLSSYTTLYATTQGRCFEHRQVRSLAVIHAALTLLAVFGSIPYWKLLGFLTIQ
ncbi:MAG TPA: SLC13 family permease [Symbiobacteriaceae bacterium]|nr:SLC13 family permease [Symbiobacteriaceae bacterium]